MVVSSDRVGRPATMTVPWPDAARNGLRSARTRCQVSLSKFASKCFRIHQGAFLPIDAVGNHIHPISTTVRYLVQCFGQRDAWFVGSAALINCESAKRLALPLFLSRGNDLHPFNAWCSCRGTCEKKERWYC
jgi:hypothetical protein